jgi:hypothetical protein
VTTKLNILHQSLLYQHHNSFGCLIKDAEFINHPFQIWASSWLNCDDDSTLDSVSKFLWSTTEGIDPEFAGLFSSKEWANRISGMHMRGPVKHIDRAIAKVVLTGSVHSI